MRYSRNHFRVYLVFLVARPSHVLSKIITLSSFPICRGLNVDHKSWRVHNYQQKTVLAASYIMGSIGCRTPQEVQPKHFYRRVSPTKVLTFEELYPLLPRGCLVSGEGPINLSKRIDTNEDGWVTLNEFNEFVLERRAKLKKGSQSQ